MPNRTFKIVDVFSALPLLGNPVAVVLDGDGLDDNSMQSVARWTNLSETTFVLPPMAPEADYRLRIFTPRGELPFAGHPTLGSAHALLEAGHIQPTNGTIVQECEVGLITLAVGEGEAATLSFTLPDATERTLSEQDVQDLERALGVAVLRETPPSVIDVGAVWVIAQLSDANQVLELEPDLASVEAFERQHGATGVTVFGRHTSGDAAIEVRTFAPSSGVTEDPVCGSGNGSVAVFQSLRGMLGDGTTRYIATHGQRVGRDGRIFVTVVDSNITIGGQCVTTVEGILHV